jgi:hypothetical protein
MLLCWTAVPRDSFVEVAKATCIVNYNGGWIILGLRPDSHTTDGEKKLMEQAAVKSTEAHGVCLGLL